MRVVSKQEAMEVARKHNMLYVETSARINEEVEYAFEVYSLYYFYSNFNGLIKL